MLKLKPVSDPDVIESQFSRLASSELIRNGSPRKTIHKYQISRADAHTRCYIELNLPCINSVVFGSTYSRGAKLLGLSGAEMTAIANFTMCYDTVENRLITLNTASGGTHLRSDCDTYLFNGQYVEKLINDMEIEKIICDTIHAEIWSELPDNLSSNIILSHGEGSVPLYSDIYLTIEDPEENMRVDANAIYRKIDRAVAKKSFSRIDMLINIMNEFDWDEDAAKDYLRGMMLLTVVPVMPLLTRPSAGKKKHTLTLAYCKLLEQNGEYSVHHDGDTEDFINYYKTLYDYLDVIVRADPSEHKLSNNKTFKNVRPLLVTMKAKGGFMRNQLSAKRQDYAGRAAVVIDPFMPLDHIGLPATAVPKNFRLWAYRSDKLDTQDIYNNLADSEYDKKIVEELKKDGTIGRVPIALGRNPTLHKQGIQGFRINVVDDRAFHMNPLVCPAYNMDFDGDTAHEEIPVTEKAVEEMNKLFITDQNLFLSKTGKCTICPRMDMLYGLYKCTTAVESGSHVSFNSGEELRQAIYDMKVKINTPVTVPKYGTGTAGKIAFLSCFPVSVLSDLPEYKPITADTIKEYVDVMLDYQGVVFNNTINELVKLGFKVADIAAESVSMLRENDTVNEKTKAFDEAYAKFHEEMEKVDELNYYGFYDSETYSVEYGTYLNKVNKALKDGVFDKVGDNMFSDMAKSGARGNAGNLVQIFGSKGRIQKSSSESYNVVIEHSLRDQLTPMEHRIAAHGARRGQIAKSLRTADTGYVARQIANAGISLVVTSKDCGTTEGVRVSAESVKLYFVKEDMSQKDRDELESKALKAFTRFVTGRFTTDGFLITKKMAAEYYRNPGYVDIRSPLTCKDPLCVKCYGVDPSTGHVVKVGTPVGIIAAQSMSEPSTQLTMKVFQKGGVQGSSSSTFDRLSKVLSQSDIRRDAKDGKYPMYDPLAWAPGILHVQPYQGRRVMLNIECTDPTLLKEYPYDMNRIISEGVPVKVGKEVKLGEPLRIERGDVYTKEALQYMSPVKAAYEMVKDIYFMFSEVDLVPIHIETIASNMMAYKPVYTDIPELKLGMFYTRKQLSSLHKDLRNTKFYTSFRGIKESVSGSTNFMEALVMEDQRSALSKAILNCSVDTMDNPLTQAIMGWYPKIGTEINPNYMEE